MAEVARYTGNMAPFAGQALADERRLFGDTVNSGDTLTENINADYFRGWQAGLIANGFPPMEFFNALGFTLSQVLTYLHQRGVPEWDNAQEFYHPAVTMGSDGQLYLSVQDNTGQDPTTDGGTNWTLANEIPIATQAEALAGTNNTNLMTPLRVAEARGTTGQYSQSFGGNGYQVFPTGFKINWGVFNLNPGTSDVTFPIAFTSALGQLNGQISFGGSVSGITQAIGLVPISLTQVRLFNETGAIRTVFWTVIGV